MRTAARNLPEALLNQARHYGQRNTDLPPGRLHSWAGTTPHGDIAVLCLEVRPQADKFLEPGTLIEEPPESREFTSCVK